MGRLRSSSLPKPPKQEPPRATEALARYDRLIAGPRYPAPRSPEDIWNALALNYLIEVMTLRERAAYYAGVSARVKARG